MSVKSISYDLSKPNRNYKGLYQEIREIGGFDAERPVESLWLVDTVLSPSEVVALLKPHLDEDDQLLVLGPRGQWDGHNLDSRTILWLRARGLRKSG